MKSNSVTSSGGQRLALAGLAALVLSALACALPSLPRLPGAASATPGPKTLYRDGFSDENSGWETGSDDTSTVAYTGGQYAFTITKDKWLTWGNLRGKKFGGAKIEVDVINKSSTDEPTFGVMCNYQDEQNYYYAGMASDGYYAIIRTQGNTDTFLTDPANGEWLQSDKIKTGAASYRLSVQCAQGRIALDIDGAEIASVKDDTFTDGQIGLFVLTFATPEADVRFDNLQVLEVP